MSMFNFIKNVFIILLIAYFAPTVVEALITNYSNLITPKTRVGVVTIDGIVYNAGDYSNSLNGSFADSSNKAVVLIINCPGGAAGSCQALHNEIQALKKEYPKPVIAFVENVCTAGGYYIACAADYIIAPGAALVGRIGAHMPSYAQMQEYKELLYDASTTATGPARLIKDQLLAAITGEQQIPHIVAQDAYEQFKADVMRSRKLSLANAHMWAEDAVYTGKQALALGLIDELGSATTVRGALKSKGMIEGEIEWVKPAGHSIIGHLLKTPLDGRSSMFAA